MKKRLEHPKGHVTCVLLTIENFENISPIAVEHTDFVVDCKQQEMGYSQCHAAPYSSPLFLVTVSCHKPESQVIHKCIFTLILKSVRQSDFCCLYLMVCSAPEGKDKKKLLKAGLFLFNFLRLTHILQFLVLREDTRKLHNSFFGLFSCFGLLV